MKKSEIQKNLQNISTSFSKEEFIYDFLLSFGLSKTTITRLKKGDYNLSKKEGELFYKGKIFFKTEKAENLLHAIDELIKDPKIARQKPRFLFVTDFEKAVAVDTKKNVNREFNLQDLGALEQVDFFLPLSGAEIYRVRMTIKPTEMLPINWVSCMIFGGGQSRLDCEGKSPIKYLSIAFVVLFFFAEDTGIFEVKTIV